MGSGAGGGSDGNGGNDRLAEAIRLLAGALDRKPEEPAKPQDSQVWGPLKPLNPSCRASLCSL